MQDDIVSRTAGVVDVNRESDPALESLLVESSTLAFRVAFGVLRHRQDAEDVAQEATAKAYRSLGQLRDRDRFRAWLVRMTWRLALDRQRSNRRRAVREATHGSAATSATMVGSDERPTALWQAIDSLSSKHRIVIVLAAIQGYDVGEVTRLLRLSPGTVKSRLHYARQHLKELLT
jgi:RNA polymerase sigma-70 factor (ECF subfamily)